MPKVFISHRWAEGEQFARELKKKLENYDGITALKRIIRPVFLEVTKALKGIIRPVWLSLDI